MFATDPHRYESESCLRYPGACVAAAFFGVMIGYSVLIPYTFSLFIKLWWAFAGDEIRSLLRLDALHYHRRLLTVDWQAFDVVGKAHYPSMPCGFWLAFASLSFSLRAYPGST